MKKYCCKSLEYYDVGVVYSNGDIQVCLYVASVDNELDTLEIDYCPFCGTKVKLENEESK